MVKIAYMNNERLDKYENAGAGQSKKPSALQPLFFAGTLIVGMFIGTNLGDRNLLQVKTGSEENPNKLVSLIDFIEDNYVDSVDKKKLIDDAIQSVLKNLDPHSYYMNPEDLAQAQEQLEGKFDGIGVEFMILRDSLVVVKTVPGGPSEEAGLKSGDRIVKVEGEEISGKELDSDKAQKLLKGKKGSSVNVEVFRKGEKLPFEITRGSIPIESVSSAFMFNDSIGYIKVERFAQTTYREFYDEMGKLKEEGCKKLVLDLRGNGGGLMDQATKMIEEFLPDNRTIVYTDGLHSGKDEIKSSKNGKFRDMAVIVLIDQSSASASEIVAGALQDWDRAVTVGRRSFGKGLVQHEIELPDRSALRLTVARYYTPTGRCIQKPYGDSIDYDNDFHSRLERGELTVADTTHFPDSLKYTTLGPLKRTVYGGGGIMPDVFVPLDSIYLNGVLGELSYSGVIREFSFNYIESRRKEFDKFKDQKDFVKKFQVSDAMIGEVLKLAEKSGIKVSKASLRPINGELKSRIKAQIARHIYDDDAMQRVLLDSDRDFKKALDVANQYNKYAAIQ
ncbi:MAG: S41 family peptidase [Flavobacteriales bacterium]|jgi:carboxyl-terminal processing protease